MSPSFSRPRTAAGTSALPRTLLFRGIFVLRVHHFPFRSLALLPGARRGGGGRRRLLVHVLGETVRTLHEVLRGLFQDPLVLGFHRLLRFGDGGLHLGRQIRGHLLPVLPERLLGVVNEGVEVVARLDDGLPFPVLGGVRLGFLDHPVDILLDEAGRRRDRDLLLLGGRRVLRIDVEDAVGVDVEGHLDLGDAAGRGRNPLEVEPPQGPVCRRHLPLPPPSSGFTPWCGSRRKKLFTIWMTFGIRVEPPTSTTSSILSTEISASWIASSHGRSVRSRISWIICSILLRVSLSWRCLGPVASAVMNGRLISVSITEESSILAFSAPSFSL